MQSSAIISILAVSILLFSTAATANNITYGSIRPFDRLLATDYIIHPSKFFGTQTIIHTYPPPGHVNFVVLSAVRIFDWGGRHNFGFANIEKFGPGYRTVVLRFKSQFRKPLNFTVQYFGYYH